MKNVISILTLIFTIWTSNVFACDCKEMKTVKEEFEFSKSVIVGNIISKEEVILTNSSIINVSEITNQDSGRHIFKYTLLISEKFKGKFSSDTLTIYTGIGSADCGVKFEIGERYIVYGIDGFHNNRKFTKNNNSIWTINCLRTRKYEKEEIEKIEKQLKRK